MNLIQKQSKNENGFFKSRQLPAENKSGNNTLQLMWQLHAHSRCFVVFKQIVRHVNGRKNGILSLHKIWH